MLRSFSDSSKPITILSQIVIGFLIIFILACNILISLTQIAAYSGIAAWLIQTHLTHSWGEKIYSDLADRTFLSGWCAIGMTCPPRFSKFKKRLTNTPHYIIIQQ